MSRSIHSLTNTHANPHMNTHTEACLSLCVYTAVNMNTKWKFARKHGGHGSYLRPAILSSSESSAPLCSLPIITESNLTVGYVLLMSTVCPFISWPDLSRPPHHSYPQQRKGKRKTEEDNTCKREWFPHGNVLRVVFAWELLVQQACLLVHQVTASNFM